MPITDEVFLGTKIVHWEDAAYEWDLVALTPLVPTPGRTLFMPGVWDIDFKCERTIDVKKAKGNDSANFTDEGYSPSLIEMTGKLASKVQWIDLQEILPLLHPRKKGEQRKIFGIQHPKATLLNIGTIYVTQIKAPSLANGIMTISISAIEVALPKKVKPGPKTGATASTGTNMLDQDRDATGVPDALQGL